MALDRERLESLAVELMERQFARVPRMRELHAGEWIERDYFVRHVVETVLRIRLNNEVDTYALFKVGSKDDALAAHLAQYLAEEFGHEGMFLRDLAKFGVSLEDVNAIPVFSSTAKLMGYLRLAADSRGPAPTTVWDWFVEWYSDRYNQVITDAAGKEFGAEFVRGTQSHLDFDESHDHDELMFRTVSRAVESFGSAEQAYADLETFVDLIGDYFAELHATTVKEAEPVGV
ncbi:iron-containing redox enzyme family protein [Streptomyces cinnabarinus]|uniref:Iron-containing redox enzyme family protein n=1 Tax=Streptomyces cinnabarinus TaxID=67287 RepID=A0ABY7KFU3_9ACTN|nr:iron-containing redox enzyme family protein [Streptomyces cinnabarinus]WAZ21801.1 iron-containing redox enzyme family protein [Streptomyces cinnabarinus]